MKKVCRKCGLEKSLDDFSRDNRARGERPTRGGMGVQAACKNCAAEARKPGILEARRNRKVESERNRAVGLKQCTVCLKIKRLHEYHVNRATPDGLCFKCAECCKIYKAAWKERNPDAFKVWRSGKEYYLNERNKKWKEENKERAANNNLKWSRANRDTINARTARRNAVKLKATPAWADLSEIRKFYEEADRLTKATGIPHEVDHIYPLQGTLVCGLHWEGNLQILTKTENIRKRNRMPEEFGYA